LRNFQEKTTLQFLTRLPSAKRYHTSMQNKRTFVTLTLLGIGAAALVSGFFAPPVQAGGGWEISKKSYVLTCSSVTVKGVTNAPFVNLKVWGSAGTTNQLANSFTATAGDTSNAQSADYKISTKFPAQPNGTAIHFQVNGSLTGAAPGQLVHATPVNVVANCVDPNATPSASPTATVSAAPSPETSTLPVASPQSAPQTTPAPSLLGRIWHFLTGWMKR
jgi:hypothetical protein